MQYHFIRIRTETHAMKFPGNDPLTDDELDRLDAFLLDRFPDEESPEDIGRDEGIICVSELDGLLTAVVIGPEVIPPSQWLPTIWGDVEPVWQRMEDFQEIMSLMMRHMNSIASALMARPPQCWLVFEERKVDDECYTIVDEWCEGFVRGMALCPEAWELDDESVQAWLAPILAFTEQGGWTGHELTDKEGDALRDAIEPSVIAIHQYWLEKRRPPAASTVHRKAQVSVGRNDPCPCGSGKKFKKCCLQ